MDDTFEVHFFKSQFIISTSAGHLNSLKKILGTIASI